MQFFQILGLERWIDFTQIGVNLIEMVYATVGKAYDFMLAICDATSVGSFADPIANMVKVFYALAGVFMLFRITISLVNYIIDPGKLTDSKVGGGKLLTNFVVVVVMLIAFYPGGIVYSFLDEIENAMIGENGFISKLFSENLEETPKIDQNDNYGENTKNIPFVEDIYAAPNKLTCYFVQTPVYDYELGKNANETKMSNPRGKYGIIKIDFYNDEYSGAQKIQNAPLGYAGSTTSHAGKTGEVTYEGETYNVTFIDYRTVNKFRVPKWPITRGPFLSEPLSSCGDISLTPPNNEKNNAKLSIGVVSQGKKGENYLNGSSKGYKSLNKAYEHLISLGAQHKKKGVKINDSLANGINDFSENVDKAFSTIYNHGLSEEATDFSNGIASSFYTCETVDDDGLSVDSDDKSSCNDFKNNVFADAAEEDAVDLIKDGKMSWDFFISIIVGIGLFIYLVILAVEVIVRNLKLVLLQMIAPIPIINSIDPNDKMRSQWLKSYFSAYLDLFLKIFAIKLVIEFMGMIPELTEGFSGGVAATALFHVVFVIALLTFAKIAPNMICKIFGIESLGGTMKQIGGMLKTGLGIGAGAAIGSAVGAGAMAATMGSAWKNTSGQSFGKRALNTALAGGMGAGTALSSALRGAGAGSKGKVFEGAKGAVGTTGSRMGKFREGISASDMIAAGTLGKFGMDYASMADKGMIDDNAKMTQLDKIAGIKGDMENTAEDSKFMKTLREAKRDGLHNLSEDKMQELRSAWIQSQLDNDDSALRNAMTQTFGTTDANGNTVMSWDYTDNMIEGGKQAGLAEKLTYAQDLIANNTTVGNTVRGGYSGVDIHGNPDNVAGISSINSFKDVDTAGKIAKKHQTKIRTDQAKIKESDKYRGSAAARDFGKSNK